MGDTTRIFWTDHTFNTHVGCLEVSEECDNCYARVLAERWAKTYGVVWLFGHFVRVGRGEDDD